MTLGQMIHKHSTSLEAQQTFMTFVDKTMVISWWDLKKEEEKTLEEAPFLENSK